jgi:hypothetical protein
LTYLYLQLGITLIEVPYWWDGKKESLAATIHHFRSDIISQQDPLLLTASPIPNKPEHITGLPLCETKLIHAQQEQEEGGGDLTILSYGENWNGETDLTGW